MCLPAAPAKRIHDRRPGPSGVTTPGWGMTKGWDSTAPTRRALSFTFPSSALPNDLVQRRRTAETGVAERPWAGRVHSVSEIGASRYGEVGEPVASRDRSS